MRNKVEAKLLNLLEYIVNKPVEQLTPDDYMVLSSELRRLKYEEDAAEKNKHLAEAMSAVFTSNCCSSATY